MNSFFVECVDYWSARIDESDVGVDWCDAAERCWRCGLKTGSLQRCHIVAKQFGGDMVPSNIVLLCRECHDEQPDVTDPREVWRWIKETRPRYGYGTLKLERALEIAMSRGVDLSLFDKAKSEKLLEDHAGLHLMQSGSGCRIKASTIAWVIEQSCQQEATDGTRPQH